MTELSFEPTGGQLLPQSFDVQQPNYPLNLSFCPEDVYTPDQIAYRLYANMPISLLGIGANLLNIAVFADVEMRTVLVNHFLLALSISDLLLLVFNFFFLVLPVVVVEHGSFLLNDAFPTIIRYSYPLALTTQTSGVYLTVLVSVHRFLGVCYPFKARRWVTRRPVQYAIAGATLFSVVVNVPTWLELSVVECYSTRFARSSHQIALASFHNFTYIFIKKTLLYTLLMFFVPFTTLIWVNSRILMALRESKSLRTMHTYSCNSVASKRLLDKSARRKGGSPCDEDKIMSSQEKILRQFHLLKDTKSSELFQAFTRQLSNNSGSGGMPQTPKAMFGKQLSQQRKFTNSTRDRSVTLMLLAIVALFLLCNGLAFCNSIVESVMLLREQGTTNESAGKEEDEWERQMVKWFESSVELSNVLITLNSSTSTIVYLVFSSKYRAALKSIFCTSWSSRKCRKDNPNRVAMTTALAAHRAVELSLIPEEAVDRDKRRTELQVKKQREQQQLLRERRRGRLFRSQTSPNELLGGEMGTMPHSESTLLLIDDATSRAVSTATTSVSEKSPGNAASSDASMTTPACFTPQLIHQKHQAPLTLARLDESSENTGT